MVVYYQKIASRRTTESRIRILSGTVLYESARQEKHIHVLTRMNLLELRKREKKKVFSLVPMAGFRSLGFDNLHEYLLCSRFEGQAGLFVY